MELRDHEARVDLWLRRASAGVPTERRHLLFESALKALWRRAHVTLGEVTLGAVTERVLYFATERYPFLSPLKVEHDGVHFDALWKSIDLEKGDVTGAFRFVLVELLSVLGNLTDDIITPSLHSELSRVSLSGEAPSSGPSEGDEGASS